MKYSILLLFSCSLVVSCSLFPQDPQRPPVIVNESGPVLLDFDYINSITSPGWVRFFDNSSGIEKYEWDFGFTTNGDPVKSYGAAPKIRFPQNGNYNVKLQGISYLGDTLNTKKTITVNTY